MFCGLYKTTRIKDLYFFLSGGDYRQVSKAFISSYLAVYSEINNILLNTYLEMVQRNPGGQQIIIDPYEVRHVRVKHDTEPTLAQA